MADAAFEVGMVKNRTVRSVSLAEGAKILTGGKEQVTELGFGSTSRTRSEIAKKLGWSPVAGDETWKRGFKEEVAVLAKL